MKKIFGFVDNNTENEEKVTNETAAAKSVEPVKSIVKVFFPKRNREYSYYNDRFDLKIGDRVFVSGKLYGQLGVVRNVNRHFRINTADYKVVLANPDVSIRGKFVKIKSMMASFDTNMTPEKLDAILNPPADSESEVKQGEIIYGEGWSVELDSFEDSEYVSFDKIDDAVDLAFDDILYISLKDGVGVAYVFDDGPKKIEFTFDGNNVNDIYCDCLYPDPCMCEHELALLFTLRELLKEPVMVGKNSFTVFHKDFLWNLGSMDDIELVLG